MGFFSHVEKKKRGFPPSPPPPQVIKVYFPNPRISCSSWAAFSKGDKENFQNLISKLPTCCWKLLESWGKWVHDLRLPLGIFKKCWASTDSPGQLDLGSTEIDRSYSSMELLFNSICFEENCFYSTRLCSIILLIFLSPFILNYFSCFL